MRVAVRTRRGFTLLEVVVATFILGGIILMMAPSASRYLTTSTKSRQKIQAQATAEEQIALLRSSPTYDSLGVRFNGSVSGVPFTGWTRTTSVVRSGAGTTSDITRVTVTVTGPGLSTPIKRTLTIAAP
ncbi:MAG TPA: prepilin-type N-terminal cleavage/methylation domain-containing protein [Gemmatimonadales bacterium]|jgi:prepilin-type N-terminal cleavage/methylation domain-containing protein